MGISQFDPQEVQARLRYRQTDGFKIVVWLALTVCFQISRLLFPRPIDFRVLCSKKKHNGIDEVNEVAPFFSKHDC